MCCASKVYDKRIVVGVYLFSTVRFQKFKVYYKRTKTELKQKETKLKLEACMLGVLVCCVHQKFMTKELKLN